MISYFAELNVLAAVAISLARLPAAHRWTLGTRRQTRALTARAQAVLVLRFLRDPTRVAVLACNNATNLATAHCYVYEDIDILTH